MEGADWAWVIVAAFLGAMLLALCWVLLKVANLVTEVTISLQQMSRETVTILGGLNETVSGVNVELARVDTIVAGVQSITNTADAMAGVVHATVSNPLIKAAAYATGVARGAKKLRDS